MSTSRGSWPFENIYERSRISARIGRRIGGVDKLGRQEKILSGWIGGCPGPISHARHVAPGMRKTGVGLGLNAVTCIATITFPDWRQLEFPVEEVGRAIG